MDLLYATIIYMEKLNQFTLDIEFLLISVVQGVALAALASFSAGIIGDLKFEYWLYVLSSLVLILNFWSQAIIHAISFINWPLDLAHNFLYFLASFIEVMAFSHLDSPLKWFGFMNIFFIVALGLYLVDLSLIRARKPKFSAPKKIKLYSHILNQEKFELKMFIPAAILFNLIAFGLILFYPEVFIAHHWHLALIGIQTLFGVYVLFDSIRSFKTRARLVTESQ